jgi:hypothetical protein
VVELFPWDAGTDSGTSFESPNADLSPHLPISAVAGPFEVGGIVPPIGTFTFRRIGP